MFLKCLIINSSNLKENGLVPRVHKNIIQFLLNYSEVNGVLLPGRVPGYSSSDIKLLPSSSGVFGSCTWNQWVRKKVEQLPTGLFVAYGSNSYHTLSS